MRIAVFTDTYGRSNGVAVTIAELIRYACSRDLPIDVYTCTRRRDSVEYFGLVRVFKFRMRLPFKIRDGLYFDLLPRSPRILKRLQEEQYSIIHFEAHGSMGFAARAFARKLNIPVVGSFNTDIPGYIAPCIEEAFPRLGKWAAKLLAAGCEKLAWCVIACLFKGCDLILAPSVCYKQMLEATLHRPVFLFSRGADTEVFNPSRRSAEFRRRFGRPIALYVGRLSPEKNLRILVDVFRKREDVILVLVGCGPSQKSMRKQLPGAEFLGPVMDRDELARIYASADVFVSPSRTETFGQAILEASASGLPSVVSTFGASKEQLTIGVTGFAAASVEEFKRYVDLLFRKAALRKAMGKSARQLSLSKGWDRTFDELFQYYESLLRENR